MDSHDSVINVIIRVQERDLGKPGAPTLSRTEFSEPTDPALDVMWTAADDNGLVITGYEARYRKKAAEGENAAAWTDYTGALSATASSLNLPGLEAGATYEVEVRAVGRKSGTPDITLSVNPTSIGENALGASVAVTATRQGSSGAVTVDLALVDGTATFGTDYSVFSLPDIQIADGQTSGSVTLNFVGVRDTLVEGSESIIVRGTATGATVGDAIITIRDSQRAGPVITGVETGPWSDVGEGTANRPPVASVVSFSRSGSLGMGGSFAWHEAAPLGLGPFFSDPDGDALTYSAAAEHAALVGVSLSGVAGSSVLTANLLNQGVSKVLYTASDAYGGQVTRSASLTVTAKTSREILEGSPAGTAVGDPVTGTPYNGVALSYTLEGKAKDSGLFAIDSATGQISVAEGAVLDYDTDDTHRETETWNGQVIAKFYRGEVHYTVDSHDSVINVIIRVNERKPGKPGAPTLSRTAFSEPTDPALDATWTAADANGLTITGYEARYRKKAAQGESAAEWTDYTGALSATASSLNLPGLEAGATYEVAVRARARKAGTPDITLSVNPASLAEPTPSGSVTVTATRQGTSGAVTVDLAISGGTATDGTDSTAHTLPDITIADGQTSGSVNMTFTIWNDTDVEGSESIILSGTASTGASVGDAIITIIDDEQPGPVITGVKTGPWSDTGEGMANRPPVASGVSFLGGSFGMGGSSAWHEQAPLGTGPYFSDADDDALTYSAAAERPALVGVSLSGAAGSAVLTANLLNQGASKVLYTASDAYGGQVTRSASVTVTAKTSREILEGSPAGTAVGAPVTGTPYNGVALSYTLEGKAKDSGLFVIDSATGQISVAEAAVLDYGTDDTHREIETYNGEVFAKFYRGEVHYTVDGHASVINVIIRVNERKFGKPGAPSLSRTRFDEPSDPALDVTWTAADDNGLVITGYEARYRKKAAQGADPAAWTDYTGALSATATSLNLPGLEAGATYEAQVRAVGRKSGTPDIALSVNPASFGENALTHNGWCPVLRGAAAMIRGGPLGPGGGSDPKTLRHRCIAFSEICRPVPRSGGGVCGSERM